MLVLAGAAVEPLLAQAPAGQGWLGRAEQARCLTLGEARRREFIAGRWLLRRLLDDQGITTAVAVDAQGRPRLHGMPGIHLSLSHRAGRVLAALADRDVGVDLERVRRRDVAALATLACTPRERRHLAGLDDAAMAQAFHELWTVKEAAFKAGLVSRPSWEFACVEVLPATRRPAHVVSWRWADGWVAACTHTGHAEPVPPAGWGAACAVSRWTVAGAG